MAWISIHEQLKDHHKLRVLAKRLRISRHEAAGLLVFLWLWGINNADRDGFLYGADAEDIALGIMSAGLSVGHSADNLVDCLIKSNWIDQIDGCYVLHDWDYWQREWFKALDKRKADMERKRKERASKMKRIPTDAPMDGHADSRADVQASPSPIPSPSIYLRVFESLWALYPRKEGKSTILKSTAKLKAIYDVGFERMTKAIENYKSVTKGRERQYIMQGGRFFGGAYIDYLPDNFEDEIQKQETGGPQYADLTGIGLDE